MKDEIFDKMLVLMNEAFIADPAAIHSLVCNRVPCNIALADHPTIQVEQSNIDAGTYNVGLLGIVNGLTERVTGRKIACQFSEHYPSKVIGFIEYQTK